MPATAAVIGYQQPRSRAVLGGEVTEIPYGGDLVILDTVAMSPDPSLRVAVVVDEVHHRRALDPFAPVQRRRGETGDHTLTPAPQPSRPRAQRGGNVGIPTDIHISEKTGIAIG